MQTSDARLLLSPASHESLGDNINGQSLIRVPDWVENPLSRYYLYFAHHQGSHIRLALSDEIMGPYEVYAPGVLKLEDSGFDTEKLILENITEQSILDWIDKYDVETILPFFPPHVASPDVHIHADKQEIWMYYHGQLSNGRQMTKVARSKDGLNFTPVEGYLGNNYFRAFQQGGYWYALSHATGTINRSEDGLTFEEGPAIGEEGTRHTAVRRKSDDVVEVYWSKFGDTPEHILVSDLDVSGDWRSWRVTNTRTVRKPEFDWEGADLPVKTSRSGFAMAEFHELRDPGIYEEAGETYLLYSVRGESGIGVCRLNPG